VGGTVKPIALRHLTEDPDLEPLEHYVVSLNGLSTAKTAQVFDKLTDQILVSGLNQSNLDADPWWERLFAATARAITSAGCYFNKVSISVKTHLINLEITHSAESQKCENDP
jgi:hypothetical protein